MVDLKHQDMKPREAKLREAIELFYFAYRAFTARADGILAGRGLGRVHHRILYFVGRNPDIAIHALLDILAVSKQALNAPLRLLVGQGLIGVRADSADRRFKRLRLTEDGRRLEAELTGTQMDQLRAVFDEAGKDAERAWRKVMRTVPERLQRN
jgi:DNA-binding MarR family transcriptional regulator